MYYYNDPFLGNIVVVTHACDLAAFTRQTKVVKPVLANSSWCV